MQIQINVPDEPVPDQFVDLMERSIEEVLAPHESKLTRVEVHLRDLNSQKGGADKRCLIEARPRGMDPLATSHESTTAQDAFKQALEKLQRLLSKRFGRLSSRER